MILKNLLTEYRNGNEEAFDKLFEEVIFTKEDNSYIKQIIIHDKDLLRLIYSTFSSYRREGKSQNKKCKAVFCGSSVDMKAIFISELYSLFNDRTFNPWNESAIFKALKYNVKVNIEDELKNQPVTNRFYFPDKDNPDDESEVLPESLICRPFDDEVVSSYSSANKQLINVIKAVNIEQLCRDNAVVQVNIAKLIKKYYTQTDNKFPTTDKMLKYYQSEYGAEISDTEYSRALNNLFGLICDNTIIYKGLDINRRDYISKFDANGTRKPDISPTIKFCCLNSDETLSLIDLVKQLDGYIPETVSGDKFQNIVVSDMIITICWKYQRLIAMIENSASLSLEDYGDMLEAIYHMLSDYIRIQIDYQLKIFMQRFKGYSFDTDYEEICRLAMGKSEEQDFWAVCDKKDGLYRPIERMNFIGRTRPL